MDWNRITSAHTNGKHANYMQKDPGPGFEPRTSLLQGNSANNCSTVLSFNQKYQTDKSYDPTYAGCQSPINLPCFAEIVQAAAVL
ncbi:hypothetical protein ATANTOWER_025204 [Ataeniobius toweri]|uniref:Uncharacterized protein n=1 Tax=Ataeniobius toweri TaxID=208326 RepID=A0ABU7BUC7_9TELE|nr:hypothetical protein [Ataeniobius toweri]